MAIKFNRSQTFPVNGTVTAAGLHNLIDGTDIYQALITDQTELTSVGTGDYLLIADSDLSAGDAPRKTTVQNLFDDVLSAGTFSDINSTGNITTATLTANKTLSTSASFTTSTLGAATATSATITTGTIPNATLGTTTSTAATITNGTVTNLNSTTGTIGRLTTTLAGDFTISQGTGTLGTSGVTAGTYGTSTIVPQIVVDAKGRVTSVGTSAVSSGKVLQVVSASVTGGSGGFSTSSTSYVDVTGMSASITPSSASNKVLVNFSIAANFGVVLGYKVQRTIGGGAAQDISVGTAYGSRRSATYAPSYYYSNSASFSLIDSPSTSGTTVTYKLKVALGPLVVTTFRLNVSYSDADSDTENNFISSSHVILSEISA